MPSHRMERVNQQIKQELAQIIQLDLKDPRVAMVSITRVKTSSDLRMAAVYVSVLGSDEETEASLKALEKASGYLRHKLRERIKMKYLPEISIRYDDSLKQGDNVLRLISEMEDSGLGADEPEHQSTDDPGSTNSAGPEELEVKLPPAEEPPEGNA
jgi:ribosome-binding factor A